MLQRSLPRAAYVDDAVWAEERARVLGRSWMCVGRNDEVAPAPGSYRLMDLQGEHVLVVRGHDGALRAVVNLCRHRGAELVDSTEPAEAGGCFGAVIRCPYHHWTYNTDGSLRGAPNLSDLDPAVDFWDLVNRQDWAICERVQRGMTSRHFTEGIYAPMEDPSLDIRRWWSARIGAP